MAWQRVGANAEIVARRALQLRHCTHPLDVDLECFYPGTILKYSPLLHFGSDPVTEKLPGWFTEHNGRQTIEPGVKEGKSSPADRGALTDHLSPGVLHPLRSQLHPLVHTLVGGAEPTRCSGLERSQEGHQAPGAGCSSRVCPGESGFRRLVVKVQRDQLVCRSNTLGWAPGRECFRSAASKPSSAKRLRMFLTIWALTFNTSAINRSVLPSAKNTGCALESSLSCVERNTTISRCSQARIIKF